jgi:hypothetical protein
MGKLFAGVLVGVALAAAGAWLWQSSTPCLGRCGSGTECRAGDCVAATAPLAPPPTKDKHRRARRDSPAAPELHLKPGDEKMIAEGDALGRPEKLDLSGSVAEPDARELSEEDLEGVFHGASPRIEKCITDALGDAPLETGRVEVGFRVEKSGSVSRVRVTAPALLQHQGLTRCIRGAVASLIFPASGAASVVTYPFELK